MRSFAVSGIVFANSHEKQAKPITLNRSMSAVPFGGRYRLIDFALSNFVNSGITEIGIITKSDYRSLMEHIGSGGYWDLDRKNGGVKILPPFNLREVRRYSGYVEALYGALDFIKNSNSEDIVLYDGCVIGNIDIRKIAEYHIEKNADITVAYKTIENYKNDIGAMTFDTDSCGRIIKASFPKFFTGKAKTSFGIIVFKKSLLISLITEAYYANLKNIEKDIIAEKLDKLNVYAFENKGYATVIDSFDTYVKANMSLLNLNVREELFENERPVFTKDCDGMPAKYGENAHTENSLVSDGCIIEGTVINSILSRDVRVKRGATVKNCILLGGVTVGENSELCYVVSDRDSEIGDGIVIKGKENEYLYVDKGRRL